MEMAYFAHNGRIGDSPGMARNCCYFTVENGTCCEGGFSEIGKPDKVLSEEDCSGFRERGKAG